LTKRYNSFKAVDNISFELREGEIFGLLGPNGAGKTSTINMLTGIAHISGGSIRIGEKTYSSLVSEAKEIMGVIPDESNLYDDLDGFENLTFCGALYGIPKKEREAKASYLLELFGLAEAGGKLFRAYSKGMKRKLTIAAGIIQSPKILFMDEPTTGIDVDSARQIRKMIKELNNKGVTILLTTHYIEEAERLCHRIAFLVKGKILRIDSVEELVKEAAGDFRIQLTLSGYREEVEREFSSSFPQFSLKVLDDSRICIISPTLVSLAPIVKFFDDRGLVCYEAKRILPSLEDVFVKITGIGSEMMKKEKEGKGISV